MKKLIYLAVLCLCLSLAAGENTTEKGPPPETARPPSPTTVPVTTPKTTEPPKPTNATAATTTTSTTTTTPKPTETTTTAKPTETTTTTTTTTAKPTPTPTPAPKPKPEIGTWSMMYPETNETCLILQMSLKLKVPYEVDDNKTANATLVVPSSANYTGYCKQNATTQNITLIWPPSHLVNVSNDKITLTFFRNDTQKKYMLSSIVATLVPDTHNFPGIKSNNTIIARHTRHELATPVKMSYKCKAEETFDMAMAEKQITKFIVTDLQMQPFYDAVGKTFSTARDCSSSETPGIVPIAVGCSLAALIIIVLIAYLVGRRRSQARGYLSM